MCYTIVGNPPSWNVTHGLPNGVPLYIAALTLYHPLLPCEIHQSWIVANEPKIYYSKEMFAGERIA